MSHVPRRLLVTKPDYVYVPVLAQPIQIAVCAALRSAGIDTDFRHPPSPLGSSGVKSCRVLILDITEDQGVTSFHR
jgi:hypothetical protein